MCSLSVATNVLKSLETSSSIGMFARDTGGCLISRLGLSRTKDESKEIKKLLESKEINLKVKVGANGKVFGAITSKEVIDEIEKVFKIKIEKKKVEANFKTIGTHTAEIKLHQDVKASLKVIVTGE